MDYNLLNICGRNLACRDLARDNNVSWSRHKDPDPHHPHPPRRRRRPLGVVVADGGSGVAAADVAATAVAVADAGGASITVIGVVGRCWYTRRAFAPERYRYKFISVSLTYSILYVNLNCIKLFKSLTSTYHIGHYGLLNLETLQRLLPGQMQLVGICGRDEHHAMLACLQHIGNDQLTRKKLKLGGSRLPTSGPQLQCFCFFGNTLTLCLYLLRLSRAFTINRLSSVSSLKDTTKACGTHKLARGASIFGTSCNEIVGAPSPDCILWVGCKIGYVDSG